MKTKIVYTWGMLLLLIMCITACSGSSSVAKPAANTDNYEEFQNNFFELRKHFSSANFISVTPEKVNIVTTSFPKHLIGGPKSDAIDDDVMKPTRLESYYKSKTSSLIVKVDFIYMPSAEEDSFVSISSISNQKNANIIEQYRNNNLPMVDDYYLTMKDTLIVIKFLNNDKIQDQKTYDEKYNSFIKEEISFYKDFEAALLK